MTVDRSLLRRVDQRPAAHPSQPEHPSHPSRGSTSPAPAALAAAPTRGRHRVPPGVPWPPVAAAVAVPLVVAAAAVVSTSVHASPAVHEAALFAHLACLVLGFGAVLTVDWLALLWLVGRRSLVDVLRTARNTHLPAWLGYAGLVASGALLEPDLASGTTWLKLGLVVLIGWNGLVATLMQAPLTRLTERPDRRALVQFGVVGILAQPSPASAAARPERRLLLQSTAVATLSQVCWWGAMAIGFLHANQR